MSATNNCSYDKVNKQFTMKLSHKTHYCVTRFYFDVNPENHHGALFGVAAATLPVEDLGKIYIKEKISQHNSAMRNHVGLNLHRIS